MGWGGDRETAPERGVDAV